MVTEALWCSGALGVEPLRLKRGCDPRPSRDVLYCTVSVAAFNDMFKVVMISLHGMLSLLFTSATAMWLGEMTSRGPSKMPYMQGQHPDLIRQYMQDIADGRPSIADYEEEFGFDDVFAEPRNNETILPYDFTQVFQYPEIPFLKEIDTVISADPGCTPTHILCESGTNFAQGHFAHAAEKLLPCWSVFQMYPDLRRVLVVPEGENPYVRSPWSSHLLEVMQVELGTRDWNACKVTAYVPKDGGGWNLDSGAAKDNTNQFLMRTEDALELHVTIGFGTTIAGESSQLRIGILNRKKTRHWVESSAFIEATQRLFSNAVVEEKYFEDASPRDQAEWVHKQDVIISPHGAQLTNLIWARRCTGIMELFPQGYYIPGFFGALASVIGGVAFAGYPQGRNPANDTLPALSDAQVRAEVRSKPLWAESESVARFLEQLVAEQKLCALTYK